MRSHRRFPSVCLAICSVVLPASLVSNLVAPGSASAATTATPPHVRSCTPLEEFLKSSQSQKFYGTGQVAWVYNDNANSESKSLTTSTSNTIEYEINASASVNAGVIFASAGASFGVGVTYEHNDTSEQTTTVSDIPPGKYGIIQIGNQMGIVKGTYEVINSTCQTTQETSTTGIFPLDEAAGTGVGMNSSPTPPWPQSDVASS